MGLHAKWFGSRGLQEQSLSLSHSVAGFILGCDQEGEAGDSPPSSLSHPYSLLPLLLLCLHDRLLPWSARLSSWNRPREASRRSLHTIPLCTKRIQFPTWTLLCLINEDHRWNSGSTSKYMFTCLKIAFLYPKILHRAKNGPIVKRSKYLLCSELLIISVLVLLKGLLVK